MLKSSPAPTFPRNRLLALLPQVEYQRLIPRLQSVYLPFHYLLYQTRAPIKYVYFPTNCMISAMTRMESGAAIEVATIGREGMAGLTAFIGAMSSPNEVIVQIAGDGLRMSVDVLKEECSRDSTLRQLLIQYFAAYSVQVSYSVACNGLHKIEQRCCRWILITSERIDSNVLPLTHELVGIMLGVRRSSVTEVLQTLQERGLIRNSRGLITIVNRPGLEAMACECYRAVQEEFVHQFGGELPCEPAKFVGSLEASSLAH